MVQEGSKQENMKAQLDLGVLFKLGLGVEQSDIEAYRWWRKAASQGDQEAQRHIKHLYSTGRGEIQGTMSMTD